MSVGSVNRSSGVGHIGTPSGARESGASTDLLPLPQCAMADDDVLVALAVMMVQQKKDERALEDRATAASSRAQEAAHARKIEAMHELADDTLMEGIVAGALEGAGAVASGVSAVTSFSSDLRALQAESMKIDFRTKDFAAPLEDQSKALARNAKLLKTTSDGFGATARFGGAIVKSGEERDRSAIAEADAARDAAKASSESAAGAVSRANEDIRATIAALRQLMAAKAQMANAAIVRG